MKHHFRIYISLALLLLVSAVSSAGADASRIASDDLLRTQLRLRDLGFYTGSIDGASNENLLAALDAFKINTDALAQPDAPNPLFDKTGVQPSAAIPNTNDSLAQSPVVTGAPLLWEAAYKKLSPNEVYTVTACYSGESFQMRYLGGTGHAHMTPVDDDAANALLLLFGALRDYGKQPVIITLDDIPAAASLQAFLHNDDAGDADTVYSLYFNGSVSDVGRLPDVDHNAIVRIAAGN